MSVRLKKFNSNGCCIPVPFAHIGRIIVDATVGRSREVLTSSDIKLPLTAMSPSPAPVHLFSGLATPSPSSSSTQVLAAPELLRAKTSPPRYPTNRRHIRCSALFLLVGATPPLLSPLLLHRSLEPEIPTPAAVELLCVAIFNVPDSYLFTAPDCRLLHVPSRLLPAAAWNTSTLVDSSPAPPHMSAS
jgi:hypothetical protein